MPLTQLYEKLRCPRCRFSLVQHSDGHFLCEGCRTCYPVVNSIPRLLPEPKGDDQTIESFGYQWSRVPSWNTAEKNAEVIDDWVLRWFGWNDFEGLKRALAKHRLVLDVGSGLGHELHNFTRANPGAVLVGLEPSKTIDIASSLLHRHRNILLIEGDIMSPPFAENTFDLVFSKGVLHHTPDTRKAFRNCASLLRQGGEIAVYVYNRKAPLREFTDDYLRNSVTSMPADEAWETCKGITELGEKLSGLDAEIEIERGIPLLGIKPGRHSLQRLMYYTMMKMFWNEALSFEENNLVNFDWYHPYYAWRHTPGEIREWCRELGLHVVWLNEEPSGIAVRAIKQ